MIIPVSIQSAFLGALSLSGLAHTNKDKSVVVKGEVLDYAHDRCKDDQGLHCTKPFLIEKSVCYDFEWSTKGKLTHTTLELREVKDNKAVHYYRDTNGQWTSDLSGLVYLDFKPKVPMEENEMVHYKVTYCK